MIKASYMTLEQKHLYEPDNRPMRIETTPAVKTTETYVLQHFVKVSHTEELRSKGKEKEKACKKRGTADDSKTTDIRITRNKHQLQHQTIITYHNKAVGKGKSFLMTTQRI